MASEKSIHNGNVPHPGNKIHIPLKTDDALAALLRVKPTDDMPRPGASTTKKTARKSAQTRQSKTHGNP